MNRMKHFSQRWAVFVLMLLYLPVARAADLFDETSGTTVFAFDEVSIPHSQNLRLEMRTPAKHPANPVVARGEPGTPDAMGVQFYGSVLREGGKFRMWYVAYDDDTANKMASARWRAAYAESDDGVHWTKPNLGLTAYRGNRNNNLILTDPAPLGFVNLKVLADPDDPNPERRYKISTHVYFHHHTRLGTLAPFVSADRLRWKLLTDAKPQKAELKEADLVLPGQGFENVGEQTFVYYGAWDPRQRGAARGGVGIATLPRDRFGDLVVELAGKGPGDYQTPEITSEFITAAMPVKPGVPHQLCVNADGLGADAALRIELLGANEKPLPGYSEKDAAIVRQSGFQTPVAWSGNSEPRDLPERIRIRVIFEGKRSTDIRFSALYLRTFP